MMKRLLILCAVLVLPLTSWGAFMSKEATTNLVDVKVASLSNETAVALGGKLDATNGVASGLRIGSLPNAILIAGDSISTTNISGHTGWSAWLRDRALSLGITSVVNKAVSGRSVSNIWENYETDIRPYAPNSNGVPRLLSLLAGINSISEEVPLDDIWNDYTNIVLTAKSDGYKFLGFTIYPYRGWGPRVIPSLWQFNERVRQFSTNFDYFVDLESLVVSPTDTNFFYDTIHPSTLGGWRIEQIIERAILGLDNGNLVGSAMNGLVQTNYGQAWNLELGGHTRFNFGQITGGAYSNNGTLRIYSDTNLSFSATGGQITFSAGQLFGSSIQATYTNTMLGPGAGANATNKANSLLAGQSAAITAKSVQYATILGDQGANDATNAEQSTILGYAAGRSAKSVKNSVLLGYRSGYNIGRPYSLTIEGNGGTYSGSNALIYGEFDNRIIGLNGSVGINTNNPQASLDVNGDAIVRSNLVVNGGVTVSNLTNNGWMALGTNGTFIATINTNTVITNVVSGGWVVITPDGKVGVGKVPVTTLDLIGAGTLTSYLTVAESIRAGAAYYIYWNGRSKMGSPANSIVAFTDSSGTNFDRAIFGTNSVTGTNFAAMSFTNRPSGGIPDIAFTGQSGATKANIHAMDGSFQGIIRMQAQTATNIAGIADMGQIFASTNNASGLAEVYVADESGNITLISPHAADGPTNLYDNGWNYVTKEVQTYAGKVRWINHSREAKITELNTKAALLLYTKNTNSAAWTNRFEAVQELLDMDNGARQVTMTESFAEFNARTGERLVQLDWQTVQSQRQADYASGYTNAVVAYNAALASGDTNAIANAVAPVWQPPVVKRKPRI
jgi:hypothetical protein